VSSILVDNRTGSKDLHALLPRGYAELTDLEYADAVVIGNGPDGSVVTEAFERKRLSDVLSCIRDGRFAGRQLRGLRRDYDFVWLIIEDETRGHPETGVLQRVTSRQPMYRKIGSRRVVVGEEVRWSDALFGAKSTYAWRDYQHWLLSMRRKGGIDDWTHTRSAVETAKFIYTTYTWRQKRWDQHKSVDVFDRSRDSKCGMLYTPSGVTKTIMDVARSFKDVGFDTASAFAEYYNSPDDFWRAPASELAEIVVTVRKDKVPVRVGRVLAESIVRQRMARRGKK
jgi:ERCC4-type nuclease